VANPKVPANNVRELIAYASANPGKLNYASIGLGTQQHLGMELFKLMTKTDINQVEYRGTAPAMIDVVAGQVEIMITGPPSAKAMSEGGKLKLLAVTGKERNALMPDVPTVNESGVPGYEVTGWFGILAPAQTPKPVLDRLTGEVRKATADPQSSGRMTAPGLEAVGSTPEDMLALMRSDNKKWADVIRATGAKIQQ
jgi:tripartite-type tricarboxylate transporter receptor subunit TctC